jgi:hypothetical protein
VFNSSKSVGLVPAREIELIVIVAVPLLVRVMVCAAEVVPCRVVGKAMLVTLGFSAGAAVPVPGEGPCAESQPHFLRAQAISVAVSSAGNVFFSTTFAGSGFGGRIMEYDPATATLRQRTDFWFGGTNTEVTYLAASGDRSTIGIVAGNISSGPVFTYSTATDAFTPEYDINGFVAYVAIDRTGSTVLVPPLVFGFKNGALTLNGTLSAGGLGVAVDPDGALGYQVSGANV